MFNLFADSSTNVEITPEYDYAEGDEKMEDVDRSKSGKRYAYKYGDYKRWEFTVMYVSSADAHQLNQWWLDSTNLIFTESGSGVENSVTITNSRKPIAERVEPYHDLFQGKIELEEY